MNRFVNTMDLLMISRVSILANQPKDFPEAFVGDPGLLPDCSLDL